MDYEMGRALDKLGIAPEHHETFVVLVDLLRTPERENAELEQLRADMQRINEILHEAGIAHPMGVGGVKDLAGLLAFALEQRDELQERLKAQNASLSALGVSGDLEGLKELGGRLKALQGDLRGINKVLADCGIEKEGVRGLWKLAILYEDARDKAAEEDLKVLKEGVERQLRRANVNRTGLPGLRELVDRYQAMQDLWAQDHRDDQMEFVSVEEATRLLMEGPQTPKEAENG